MPPIKFKKYVHSPFSYSLDGVRAVVESNGKVAIHQIDDLIECSAGLINKLNTMKWADRPLIIKVNDIEVTFMENKKIQIKQFDTEGFDCITTSDSFISNLSRMLLATRTIEWTNEPYKSEYDDIELSKLNE